MSGHAPERRDEVLGAALRELDVPEHRPGFHNAVRAALEREAVGQGDAEWEPRRVRPRPPRRRRPHPRRSWAWGLATAAAITALALVAVMAGLPGQGPRVATAAEVRARVTQAWVSAESIAGVLTIEGVHQAREARGESPSRVEGRWSFLLTAPGDFRLTRIDGPDQMAYDAGTNVERGLNTSASIPDSDVLFASELTGLAPGPPDPGPSSEILDRGLGSVVRALATSRGGRVREITYEGQEAWLLETDLPAVIELSPDHLRVTVDRETGFPVRVEAFGEGRRLSETRIDDLRVNPLISEDAFKLGFPAGMEVSRDDYGFRRVRLGEVKSLVGYDPLVPGRIPEGYRLSEVMVSEKPTRIGAFEDNPAVGDIVSLSYRRGLDQFVVTTRPVGEDPRAWADPFDRGEGRVREPERVMFAAGALTGRRGELVVDPMTLPHVWATTGQVVVTVSGDLASAELLRVAESLEEWT